MVTGCGGPGSMSGHAFRIDGGKCGLRQVSFLVFSSSPVRKDTPAVYTLLHLHTTLIKATKAGCLGV